MAEKTHKKRKDSVSAWQEAEAAGFDMSLVEENLRMTPLERTRQHERALNLAVQLREAMTQRNAGL